MPSTTTTATITTQNILADYALRHTGGDDARDDAAATNHSHPRLQREDYPLWDTTYRRVPPYRPINTTRDQSEVRVYQNGIERIFISVMFTGVFVNASFAQAIRYAFGRDLWEYPIGGET
ncbi:hypothetical protein GGR58DRAFT_477060 [Xylaria digitata]|nr:hypothetical protein GGR58DRAFT_477060 [Xylaria digitata]